jgi:transposase
VESHTRKGRPALPKDLPRTRIEYDLSDEQKMAFDTLERIGEERSETLHYEPSSSPSSSTSDSTTWRSLLANVLVNSYVDHLPLNRQEMRYARRGVYLPRATLYEWKLASAELLSVLLPGLRAHQLQAPRMLVDDMTLPLAPRRPDRCQHPWRYHPLSSSQTVVRRCTQSLPSSLCLAK